jgi:hypothetical protein
LHILLCTGIERRAISVFGRSSPPQYVVAGDAPTTVSGRR